VITVGTVGAKFEASSDSRLYMGDSLVTLAIKVRLEGHQDVVRVEPTQWNDSFTVVAEESFFHSLPRGVAFQVAYKSPVPGSSMELRRGAVELDVFG
jgi:hypothetical protein